MKVKHNISRIEYLMKMYRMGQGEFLRNISNGLKTPITEDDVFGSEIKINHLKRIDKLFEKGIHYYVNPEPPIESNESSIFFRKKKFQNDSLNIGAIKIVNKFENFNLSLSTIAKLSDLNFNRQIKKYKISDNPIDVALEIRNILYPKFHSKRREFLKALIYSFASQNIMVFEFVEAYNKKEKANIDGFYIKPNMIVLKRYQSFSREIFTLAHELGHYLLDKEEIEEINGFSYSQNLSRIEQWCNNFAFLFLVGEYEDTLNQLDSASSNNDYHHALIEDISNATHLSKSALFTRLLYKKKITNHNYNLVISDFKNDFRKKQEEKEKQKQKQLLKSQGIKSRGSIPKPISSPLLISTIEAAYYDGVLNEYEVCKKLNIRPEKLEKIFDESYN